MKNSGRSCKVQLNTRNFQLKCKSPTAAELCNFRRHFQLEIIQLELCNFIKNFPTTHVIFQFRRKPFSFRYSNLKLFNLSLLPIETQLWNPTMVATKWLCKMLAMCFATWRQKNDHGKHIHNLNQSIILLYFCIIVIFPYVLINVSAFNIIVTVVVLLLIIFIQNSKIILPIQATRGSVVVAFVAFIGSYSNHQRLLKSHEKTSNDFRRFKFVQVEKSMYKRSLRKSIYFDPLRNSNQVLGKSIDPVW